MQEIKKRIVTLTLFARMLEIVIQRPWKSVLACERATVAPRRRLDHAYAEEERRLRRDPGQGRLNVSG